MAFCGYLEDGIPLTWIQWGNNHGPGDRFCPLRIGVMGPMDPFQMGVLFMAYKWRVSNH